MQHTYALHEHYLVECKATGALRTIAGSRGFVETDNRRISAATLMRYVSDDLATLFYILQRFELHIKVRKHPRNLNSSRFCSSSQNTSFHVFTNVTFHYLLTAWFRHTKSLECTRIVFSIPPVFHSVSYSHYPSCFTFNKGTSSHNETLYLHMKLLLSS